VRPFKEKNMDTQPEWKRAFRVAVFVHATIVATILIYALVLEVLKTSLRPMPRLAAGTNVQVLRYIFYGLAIVAVVLVRQVNRGVLRNRPGEPLREYLHRLSRTAVLSSILSEAPALLGLVLAFLTGVSRDFWYLMFVSFFLAFMYFPRRRTWTELLHEKYPQEGV
jgi:F0F1-type ATP synthase membrane subunit c/vacuolar-type H+-ATPase subunit K